jgi:hypothetical protein
MKRYLLLVLLMGFFSTVVFAQNDDTDNVVEENSRRMHNRFIGLQVNNGMILSTDEFTSTFASRYYQSLSLKFGFRSTGNCWTDFAYGMPYVGIGVRLLNFPTKREIFRNPIAVYLFHGGTIRSFSPRFSLHYEWNLGASFNWGHFDPFDNPENIVFSTPTNIYASLNAYTRWRVSPRVDFHLGLGFNHFSNGSVRLPNRGMNLFAPFVEITYALDCPERNFRPLTYIPPPTEFEQRIDYEFMLTVSSRQTRVDTLGTGLPSRYLNYNFPVFGFSFTPLFVPSRRYRYGVGLDIIYDRSSNVRAWREPHPISGNMYDRIELAPFSERLSVGLSARGEITMPVYTFFANIGYNIIQQTNENRFYQVIGVKFYPRNEMFVTFGIRATNFSRAQFLYWSVGYTLRGRGLRRR